MGYRDPSESLRAYRERIVRDLEEARCAAREAADRGAKVQVLEKELAETEGLLEKMGGKRTSLPLLEGVNIAAPCTARWDEMVGDEHVRFCGQCEKNVYNLSSLPREEAEALLGARDGKMCVRLYRREDGTVLTSDCPVGVKKRRRRRAAVAVVGGGLMAAAAALGLDRSGARAVAPDPTEITGAVAEVPRSYPTTESVDPGPGHWMGGAVALPRPPPTPQGKVTQGKPGPGKTTKATPPPKALMGDIGF